MKKRNSSMRDAVGLVWMMLLVTGCGSDDLTKLSIGSDGTQKLHVQMPSSSLQPLEENGVCFYFQLSNTEELNAKGWQSQFSAGVASMEVYFTQNNKMPPGTVSTANCAPSSGDSSVAQFVYAASASAAGWTFPNDDGTGKPLGKRIKSAQSGFIRLHVLNPTNAPIQIQAELDVIAYKAGTEVTRAEPYFTYDADISIQPGASKSETTNCNVPAGSKFVRMTTLSNKQSVHTYIKDGSTVAFESTDWSNPGASTWSASPFFEFSSGKMTIQCNYTNPNSFVLHAGPSYVSDETCAAATYYFPATTGMVCYDGLVVPN